MIILFFILLIVLLAVLYYDVRGVTSKLPKDVFRFYDFSQKNFLGRDVYIIKPLKNDDLYEPEVNDEKEKVILYIHGGSYVGELEKYHWNFFKDIINDTKATIIVPDYPLAPEHTYLEVFKIMEPLYKKITDKIKDLLRIDQIFTGLVAAAPQIQNPADIVLLTFKQSQKFRSKLSCPIFHKLAKLGCRDFYQNILTDILQFDQIKQGAGIAHFTN